MVILTGTSIAVALNGVGTLGSSNASVPGLAFGDHNAYASDWLASSTLSSPPFEGFSLSWREDATNATASNNNVYGDDGDFFPAVTGGLFLLSGVEYRGEKWDRRAIWRGSNAVFTVEHDVRFNMSMTAALITTRLTALVDGIVDVTFARSLDPTLVDDENGTATSTHNTRLSSQLAIASAPVSGRSIGIYIVGAVGPDSLLGVGFHAGVASRTTDPRAYLDSDAGDGDYTIGVCFAVGDLPAGSTAVLTYAYVLGDSASGIVTQAAQLAAPLPDAPSATPTSTGIAVVLPTPSSLPNIYCAPGALTRACVTFEPNTTASGECYCPGEGPGQAHFSLTIDYVMFPGLLATPRRLIGVNGSVPGPTLTVYEGDWVVVDVQSTLDVPTTVHWHGIIHVGTGYADGVPGVTQCLIPPFGALQYSFRASRAGTYWYVPFVHCRRL